MKGEWRWRLGDTKEASAILSWSTNFPKLQRPVIRHWQVSKLLFLVCNFRETSSRGIFPEEFAEMYYICSAEKAVQNSG